MDKASVPFSDEIIERTLAAFPDALLLCNGCGAVRMANSRAKALIGAVGPLMEHASQLIPEIEEWGPEGLRIMAEAGELDTAFPYPIEPPDPALQLTLSVRASTLLSQSGDTRVILSLRDISEERRLQKQLRTLSMTDELTGIPNRRLLHSTLAFEEERARRFSKLLFLMFLDLDDFKSINDTYGHPVGDKAIRHFSAVVSDSIRKIDTVCRWGGDEFVVVGLCTTHDGGLTLLHRLLKAMRSNPLMVGDKIVPILATVGMVVARYPSDGGCLGEVLLQRADELMLQAKTDPNLSYLVGEIDAPSASL